MVMVPDSSGWGGQARPGGGREPSRGRRGVNRDTSSARHPGGASRSSHGFLAAIVAAAYTGFSPAFVPFSLQQRTIPQHMLRDRFHLLISEMSVRQTPAQQATR